jgi:hypothetical protein
VRRRIGIGLLVLAVPAVLLRRATALLAPRLPIGGDGRATWGPAAP